MNNKKYTAAVIGLGNIGMEYDYSHADDRRIMTHSSAYHYHPGYELISAVDPDKEKRDRFTQKFGVPAYSSLKEMQAHQSPEVYSIAAPTDQHYALFCELVSYQSKAILCEKPFSDSLQKAVEMKELCKKNNIILFVNYMRQFEPGIENIISLLKQKSLGNINKIIVKYSNGFLNCATHFLDLVRQLFGKIEEIQKIKSNVNDYRDIYCRIDNIDIYFIATGPCKYSLYELEIIAETGVLRYQDAGRNIYYQLSSDDQDFENARGLNISMSCENDYSRFQWYVMETMYQALIQNAHHLSNVDSAIDVWRLVSRVEN